MPENLNIFKKYRVRVDEMLQDSIDFMVDKFKQSRKMFTVSSVYGQILYVLENLFQLNLFYIEDSISEMNIHRASRNSSKFSLVSLAGHNPGRAIAASGEVKIKTKTSPDSVPGGVAVIPGFTRLSCENNNRTYVLVFPGADIRVPVDQDNEINATVYQGRLESQTFTGRGRAFDSIVVPYPVNAYIDNFIVDVYVNDVKWRRYNSLLQMPAGTRGFVVRTGVNAGLEIYFGNGKVGRSPNAGDEIRVEYLVTDGFVGRLKEETPDNVKFTFMDSGLDMLADELDLNDVFDVETVVVPDFGANPENLEFLSKVIPRRSEILVRLENYETFLERLGYFSVVRVDQDDLDERMINMVLVPNIVKTSNATLNYFTVPYSAFSLSDAKKQHLLSVLERMGTKLIATDARILDPKILRYVLNIGIVAFEGYNQDIIKNEINVAMGEYFLSLKRRDRVPRSDLVRIIEGIDGVDSVNINIVSEANEKSKKDDPTSPLIGMDAYNDIIIKKDELPIIRGGWSDRNGNYYHDGLPREGNLGSVNIRVSDVSRRKYEE